MAERAVWQVGCKFVVSWLVLHGLAAALHLFKLVFAAAQTNGFSIGQLYRATSVRPAGGKFVGSSGFSVGS